VIREIERKSKEQQLTLDIDARLLLKQCKQLFEQKRNSKNKLYSFHEPKTVCISKGKAHKRYEFGNKSTFITTAKECFILHADAHEGNPYNGHTLAEALKQTKHPSKRLPTKQSITCLLIKGIEGTAIRVIRKYSLKLPKTKRIMHCLNAVLLLKQFSPMPSRIVGAGHIWTPRRS